jgi:hypothetical protein
VIVGALLYRGLQTRQKQLIVIQDLACINEVRWHPVSGGSVHVGHGFAGLPNLLADVSQGNFQLGNAVEDWGMVAS